MPTSAMPAAAPNTGAYHAPVHSGQGGVRLGKGALAGIIAGIVVLIIAIALIAFTLGGGFASDEPPAQDATPTVTEPEQPSNTPDNATDKTTAPKESSGANDQADSNSAPAAQPNSLEATVAAVKSGATGPTLRVDSSYPGRSSDVAQGDITTSTTLPASQYGDYKGSNVIDGDPATAWVEGADGSGAGSYIICNTGRQTVDSLLIMAGYAKSSDIYYKNARPAQVTIIGDGQVLGTATLADDRCGVWQKIYLDKSVAATNLCLRIDSVYEGSKYSDCAISEMYWDNHSK